ncbi:thiomuracin/GE37468 family thiazolyl RiPP peptide [Halostreptopolyspora alba]|uniref:GE37468 family thiazolyl peptide n=1 Tax=Halostreptopolyspora alba TaxID=2487137 RepID=A0A3N0EDT6_9ACTN|nr:GE37468 family thiazolyl peptide [Nocardiopsaceae bacterium YIM 96095]
MDKNEPAFEVDDLPVDVFSLSGESLTVESLTSGHGTPENGASCFEDDPTGSLSCTS